MGAGMLELSGLQGSSLHPPPPDGDTATIAGYKGAAAGGAWDVFARTVAPIPAAGNAEAPSHPALLLLLARVCEFLKGPAVAHVTKALGATFPGQASSAGSSSQPSAFVADEIARSASSMQICCIPANVLALLRHQALLHACTMATGTDWSCMQAAAADAGGAVGRLCGRAGPAVEQRRARSSGGCSGQRCWRGEGAPRAVLAAARAAGCLANRCPCCRGRGHGAAGSQRRRAVSPFLSRGRCCPPAA